MTARLTLGGGSHEGWTEITVRRSIESLAGSFQLAVTDRDPGTMQPRAVTPGAACTLALGGETVITGFVDAVDVSHDSESHSIGIQGRDRAGDLVDCSADQQEWKDETVDVIAAAIAAPFGIGVGLADGVAPGEPFRKFTIERGETAWDAIDRLTRMRAVLAVSDGRGGIQLTRAGRETASVRLERGVNILAAQGRADASRRHSTYTVLGQRAGDDEIHAGEARNMTQVRAEAQDAGITRHRPLVLLAEQGVSPGDAQERADWEAAVRRGRSREIVATVQGWRERPGGDLWTPGKLVRVVDDWLGLDRDLLIATVEQKLSGDGTRTALTLMPKSAFLPEPDTEVRGSGTDAIARTDRDDTFWGDDE